MIIIILLILKIAAIAGPGYMGWSAYQDYTTLKVIENATTIQMVFKFNDLSMSEDIGDVHVEMPMYLETGKKYKIKYSTLSSEDIENPGTFNLITDPKVASVSGIEFEISSGSPNEETVEFTLPENSLNESGDVIVSITGNQAISGNDIKSNNQSAVRIFSPAEVSSMKWWAPIKAIGSVILLILGVLFVIFIW